MKNLFIIPEVNVEKFEKAMNKLVKQSIKLNAGDVRYELVSKEFKTDENNQAELYHTYEVTGDTPTLNGYIVVAILEKQQELNLVFHMDKEQELPRGLENSPNHCEHCNHNRARKHLFILKNETTGKYIQVGKTCVKDFTGGHHSPSSIANYYQVIEEIQALETSIRGSHAPTYIKVIDAIAISAYHTDVNGYVRTNEGTDKNPSTKRFTIESLSDDIILMEVQKGNYTEKAQQVVDWILSQQDNNDYMTNLKTLTREGFVSVGRLGFIVSAYSSYQRAIDKAEKAQQNGEVVISQHVGEVGSRADFELIFSRGTWFETAFGTMNIYFFKDDKGNELIWKTGNGISADTGDKITMKATIKEHSEYKNKKQTVLTRCSKIQIVA